jgi:hypothetical protein
MSAFTAFTTVDDKSTLIDEAAVAQQAYKDQINDAAQAVLAQAAAATSLAEEQAKANGETFTAADAARVQAEELQKVADGLAPDSPLRLQLQGYIDKIREIPPTVKTILEIEEQLKVSDRSAGGGILGGGNTGGGVKKFDHGGIVPGPVGRPRLVLAHGGEEFTPTHRGAPSKMGGISVTVNAANEPEAVVRALMWELGRMKGVAV